MDYIKTHFFAICYFYVSAWEEKDLQEKKEGQCLAGVKLDQTRVFMYDMLASAQL